MIHNPEFTTGLWDGMEDGASVVQVLQCLSGAAVDFALYYSVTWVSMFFDDAITKAPDLIDFSAVTGYKEFSWSEAAVSAGTSCIASVIPALSSNDKVQKLKLAIAAFAGAAEGMATELAKQYDITSARLLSEHKEVGMREVVPELNWIPILSNAGISAAVTAFSTYVATNPKYAILLNKVKDKLKVTGSNFSNELLTYINNRLGRVVSGTGSALVNSLSQTLKAVHFKLVNGGMQIVEQGNIIKYLAKNGDEIAKIENGVFSVSKAKGSIPNPSTYLDATYITNHINKFKQEGAGFIVVKSWTEGGNPIYTALPSRKFVGLRSEMDAVIAKYKAQGNDRTVLRDELNLGSSTNLSAEEIYYIKIDGNDTRFNFDVPNGNEGGAIVGEWVPSGYTKSGTAEAALVGAENIVHNKSMTQLLNYFPNKWEKIK